VSVVEKSAPQRTIVGLVVGVVVVLVLAIAVAFSVNGDSSSTADRSGPSSTTRPVTTVVPTIAMMQRVEPIEIGFDRDATYRVYLQRTAAAGSVSVRVFAYIDPARQELRFLDSEQPIYGAVVGRFADMLVLDSGRLRVIDRDFATAPLPINGDDFVGTWHEHAIVAEYFPERTTFHEYGRDSREVRSVALVGRRPDVIGGVVGGSVIVERAGRLLRVGLTDSIVREFAVGNLIGVGGDRIYYTACTTSGACTINESTIDGTQTTMEITGYIDPGAGTVRGRVSPDGSALVVHRYRHGEDVVLPRGLTLSLPQSFEEKQYVWTPNGRWLLHIDSPTKQVWAIDAHDGDVVTVALPAADMVSLRSVAAW
jgi:hypothetical protein